MTRRSEQHDCMDLDHFEELLADMPKNERWELIGGRVVRMMAGARWQHNYIIQNTAYGLRERFRAQGSPWRTLTETFYLKRRLLKSATLPDVIVRCGSIEESATSIDDPKVLVEVTPLAHPLCTEQGQIVTPPSWRLRSPKLANRHHSRAVGPFCRCMGNVACLRLTYFAN